MSDFTLEPAELAFLLTLVNATGIPGVDLSALFPADEGERYAFLEKGGYALANHGHMRIENRQFHDLNPLLPLAAATLAAPEQIIHTTAFAAAGDLQAAHYLAGPHVVEFYINPEGNYRVVVLDSVETAIRTIAHNLGVVHSGNAHVLSLTIPPELLADNADIRAAVAAALAESDIPPADGTRIMTAISTLDRVAEIDLAHVIEGEVQRQESVLLFRVDGTVGMLHARRLGATTVTIPASAGFERTLLEGIHALRAMRLAV